MLSAGVVIVSVAADVFSDGVVVVSAGVADIVVVFASVVVVSTDVVVVSVVDVVVSATVAQASQPHLPMTEANFHAMYACMRYSQIVMTCTV